MPAEVQITELAMNRAQIERGCAPMAVRGTGLRPNGELLTKLGQWEGAGIGAGLTSPAASPGMETVCMDTHMERHLWQGGMNINDLH